MLLNLGKLLLELGNLKDWSDLKDRYRMPWYNEGRLADYFQARLLAKTGRSGMPRQYLDVVDKIIDFQFSPGNDLSKLELQAVFYQQVIEPLEKLENRLEELKFDN